MRLLTMHRFSYYLWRVLVVIVVASALMELHVLLRYLRRSVAEQCSNGLKSIEEYPVNC
jgi:hypothetical protein